MKTSIRFRAHVSGLFIAMLFSSSFAAAGPDASSPIPVKETSGVNWYTGEGVSLGGILFPHVHAITAFGGTTASSVEQLALSHHDPQSTFTLQGLELGTSLRLNDYIQGFAIYSLYTDADQEFDGEFEEYFLKLSNLPGGTEVRGGRFFNRFLFSNALHNHGWDFVNVNLTNGRLLQEGELITIGGEFTWHLPLAAPSSLVFSLGKGASHDHEHDHEEEAEFESEGVYFDRYVAGISYYLQLDYNDFHQNRIVLSAAFGENEFKRTSQIYGLGYEYAWRQNGYEAGGKALRWRTELVYRNVGAIGEEHDHHHDHDDHHHDHDHDHEGDLRRTFDEYGISTSLIYDWNDHLSTALRVEYVEGITAMGLDERWRISPNITLAANAEKTLFTRVQYDLDHSSEFGTEHSIWLQIGFNWGGPEVR